MAVRLGWCLLPLLLLVEGSDAAHQDNSSRCQPGLLLPVWLPQDNLNLGDRVSRGLVYFFAMIYLFIGVSIISDRFMASIEVITSQEKEVTIKKKNGETQIVVVRVWNETVANLTLMALGSSAPEILLSIIEIGAKKFEAGELGPGTIVGSAAYNLFVIIALCVSVIPDGEVRKIKHLRVFFVTATWSVFAYVWLYLIVSVISEGEIEVWEGLLTFMFFPATVLTAWIADRRLLIYKYLHKNYRMNRRGMIVETEGDIEMVDKMNHVDGGLSKLEEDAQDDDVREFEHNRREYITTLRDLRKKYPLMELEQIEVLAQEEVLNKGPKSRAFYRIQATRKMVGGGNIMKKIQERAQSDLSEVKAEILKEEESGTRVFFDPGHYTVMESVGQFEVTVVREGDLGQTLLVDYTTEDGSAEAGSDYVGANGTLTFAPGDVSHTFSIEVIDDDLFEEDEHFYVRLLNLRVQEQSNGDASLAPSRRMSAKAASPLVPQLVSPSLATVMILDDDHGGIFGFAEKDTELVESVGQFDLKVIRYSGARGKVSVHYTTEDGTGKAGKEYEEIEGDLIFENNESEQTIPLRIIDEDSYEKDVLFYVQLEEPKMIDDEAGLAADAERKKPEERTEQDKMALLGRPKLGDIVRAQIRVKESKEFKNTVDKLVQRANASILIGTSSWKEQFIEALSVSPGDDGGGDGESTSDGGDDKNPSCGDYVMHFVTLFWKLLFAFVPPTDMAKGYLCFVVSILGIGIVTAVIGDVASSFGCTLGIQDSVTAIAFVALGTSIPDMLGGYLSFVVSIAGIGALTAVIGDVASHFGCTVGLEDAVTAIAFVALGTSVPDLMNGVLCFCVSISCIGVLTAVIGDTASHFGCTLGIRDAVTAVSIVAMGTSIPDTFASKVAAIQDKYADASVGNVTGSNAVNVFLGIGIAWSIAAIYHACNGTKFLVDPGNMAFSVTIFCTEAFVAILILVLRRSKIVGGELGGPKGIKYFTSAVLFSLWLIYVILSSLEVYDVIEGF